VRLTGASSPPSSISCLHVLPIKPLEDQINVLLTDDSPWALVKRSVSDMRRVPDGLAEQVTQLLVGESVRILEEHGSWSLVRAERDGYLGWTRTAALHVCDRKTVRAYHKSANVLVKAGFARASISLLQKRWRPASCRLCGIARNRVTARLGPSACRTIACGGEGSRFCCRWLIAQTNAAGIAFTLDLIKPFVASTPYQWGAHPYGYDCAGWRRSSGGSWVCRFRAMPINNSAPARSSRARPRPGDLLFFSGDDSQLSDGRQQHIRTSSSRWAAMS